MSNTPPVPPDECRHLWRMVGMTISPDQLCGHGCGTTYAQSRAEDAAAEDVESFDTKLRKALHEALLHATLQNTTTDEGNPYPLVDALTPDGSDIGHGQEECEYLAESLTEQVLELLDGARP